MAFFRGGKVTVFAGWRKSQSQSDGLAQFGPKLRRPSGPHATVQQSIFQHVAMLLMFSSVVLVAVTVRLPIVVSKGPLTQEVLGTGQNSDGRGWIDLIAMAFWSGIAGVLLVIDLAAS